MDGKANDVSTGLGRLRIDIDAEDRKPAPRAPVAVGATPASVTITVTELQTVTPPLSPTTETAAFDRTDRPLPSPPQAATPGTFPFFPLLPAELRLAIWHLSFLPRAIELHTRRTHYADDDRHGGTPKWQSQSRNPAALAVSAEARAAALEFYTVALPLAAPLARNQTFELPGDQLQDSDRVLYLNLAQDTVILLGDLHYARLVRLLAWFRDEDGRHHGNRAPRCGGGGGGRGKGLRHLAMSVAPWGHPVGAATLKVYARSAFADIEEFVLFMYNERMPPADWAGGRCMLVGASADADHYRRFVMGRGKQFREGDGWMVVGKRPMKVVDIWFADGW
ncbi:hypothetical protein B0T24DRAFT_249947 [Lasiosphaeria ovina]|uniref:2EXR domain-containing protein n=1 Tax=Lasiosphaeria ovina TaxID=92902 RepID=A0AAE0N6Z4_9PEZI|nr:hypothetical protein B0T24DRAFT_249947 [Lasiosphaeria ovina]